METLTNGIGQVRSSTFQSNPSRDDATGVWVQRTFSRFRHYRRQYDTNWIRYGNLFDGNQWPGEIGQSDFWKARITVNYIRAIIQTIVSICLDSDPTMTCSADHPNQQDYAQGLQMCIQSLWSRGEITAEVRDALTNACKVGTAYMFGYWDPQAESGQGEIVWKNIPTECVYPQPGARRVSDCDQLMILRRESRAWLEKYFPDKAHLCRPAQNGELDMFERRRQESAYGSPGGGQIYLDGPLYGGYGFAGDDPTLIDKTNFRNPPYATRYGTDERYDVLEVYVRDDSIIEEEVTQDVVNIDMFGNRYVTQVSYPVTRKRYPTGWRHMFVCGETTLEDTESPYPCIPLVKVVDESQPDEFFGTGEPQQLEALQYELNKRRSQMIDHASLSGGAVWLVNRDSQITKDELSSRPAQIIRYVQTGTEIPIKREPGVPMPSFMLQMVEITIRDMREISGVSAQASGSPPKGARSGAAFEKSQDIATGRIRMRTHNLEQAIREMGRITIKLIQMYYTELRWIRVVGHMGFEGHVPFEGWKLRGDWDLNVMAGSTMNMTESAKQQRDIELFKAKAIDQIALLQNMHYPGWQDICKRMGAHIPEPYKEYYGYPGQPDRDSTNTTGYAFGVRSAGPPQTTPSAPAPGGQMPGLPMAAAPIGGNPQFAPQNR